MISLLIIILFIIILFKVTSVIFHVIGTLLGGIISIIGWLFIAGLAVTLFGFALIAIPVILVVGGVALISASES